VRSAALLALLAGCSAVYNADYDDRESALAASSSIALPASDKVQFVTTGDNRLYWTDEEQAAEAMVFHSIDTTSGKQVDYQFGMDDSQIQSDLGLGQDLVVLCQEGEAFDAGSSSMTPIAQLSTDDAELDTHCAVLGSDVYLIEAQTIVKWRPDAAAGSNQTAATVIDLMALNVNTSSITGLAVADATHIVYGEGNNLWLLTPGGASGSASLLNAETNPITTGIVALDSEGVVYPVANSSPMYATFSDPMNPTLVSDMIANGGYDLLGNGSIQQLGPNASYTIADNHLVYEGSAGIFALGLDTGNVVDILLDGRADSEGDPGAPQYQLPAVTTSDLMFVQDMSIIDADTNNQAVFEVDLTGRLK
jgi:hypothetical protein